MSRLGGLRPADLQAQIYQRLLSVKWVCRIDIANCWDGGGAVRVIAYIQRERRSDRALNRRGTQIKRLLFFYAQYTVDFL